MAKITPSKTDGKSKKANSTVQEGTKKVELILFLTGIFLLVFATILVFAFPEIRTKGDVRYEIVKVILALSTALVVSQIPGMIKINLPFGIKAIGGIAFGVMIYMFTPNAAQKLDPNDLTEMNDELGSCNYPKLRLVILCSGNNDYTRSITTSLLNSLQPLLPTKHKKCLYYDVHYGPREPYDSVKKIYLDEVANIIKREVQYDFYISIGTSASLAFKDYFRVNKITDKNFIFLGVTDPVACGLVSRMKNRNESSNTGGVAYCGNFEELPARVHELYPNNKMEYIYWTAYPQDGQIADRIDDTNFARDSLLTIKKLNRLPVLDDMSDTSKVYFSWVTMENMFESQNIEILMKVKNLVSTTQTHAMQGLIPFAVSTSDIEIGRKGAILISDNLTTKRKLGETDIYIPNWKVYANCRTAKQKGIKDNIIKLADDKFDCGD